MVSASPELVELLAFGCSPTVGPRAPSDSEVVDVAAASSWGDAVRVLWGGTAETLRVALGERPTRRLLLSGHLDETVDLERDLDETVDLERNLDGSGRVGLTALGLTAPGGGLVPMHPPSALTHALAAHAPSLDLVILNGGH